MRYIDKFEMWLNSKYVDSSTKEELKNIKSEKEIEDRFYKELEFGTGGLRGIIGAGTNRINIYTVSKTTQGFANYLKNKYESDISVCIAYDSRIMSKEFAEKAGTVLCANEIKVFLFESLRPTPMLSYAVRKLNCNGGIVITASHNPKEYNGYKVYGKDGGQVTDKYANEISNFIKEVDDFSKIKYMKYEDALNNQLLEIIGENIDKSYIEEVKSLTIRDDLVKKNANDLNIIYTPLHGSGNIPVRRVLSELGYENLFVVKEQEMPDGRFPTTPYPNPEDPKVFEISLDMAKSIKPDIIFGTDPDCDRIGVVVKDNNGEYQVLTGNQVGILLTNYIITSLNETKKMPVNPVIIKTMVTTEMVRKIAFEYNVELIDVLTGFKYIGEKIKEFELNGDKSYIFGFEESYGYLSGTFVRDKDAVIASVLICEMTLYYKNKGMSLYDGLIELYDTYGWYNEKLLSFELKGKEGQEKISKALEYLRENIKYCIGNKNIIKKIDYSLGTEKDLINNEEKNIDLPKSNVLKFVLEDESWFVIRPSGTEPKMKVYLSVVGENKIDSEKKMKKLNEDVLLIVKEACNC